MSAHCHCYFPRTTITTKSFIIKTTITTNATAIIIVNNAITIMNSFIAIAITIVWVANNAPDYFNYPYITHNYITFNLLSVEINEGFLLLLCVGCRVRLTCLCSPVIFIVRRH